ncbi:putative SMP domain-containing protein [Seiridium cardinale]|uniref:SMP domain-containing protein n=1 Tax=Seiridium unicorne TaxID=138068 RepID=A0ABR2UP78_9PEZI
MTSEFPSKDQLRQQAIDGRPITQSEASAIATAEADRSDAGLVKGGSAATAQSLHDKQQNFLEKAGGAARKYPGEVTKEDAAEVQRAEARLLGERPGKGSTSAKVQSLADQNAASIGQ